jgi:hypothetical protein
MKTDAKTAAAPDVPTSSSGADMETDAKGAAAPDVPTIPAADATSTAAKPASETAATPPAEAAGGGDAADSGTAPGSGKRKKARCETCRKKIGLTGFTCRWVSEA